MFGHKGKKTFISKMTMQITSDVVTGFCVFSCEVQIIVAYASTVNITQPNQSDKLTTDQTCFLAVK